MPLMLSAILYAMLHPLTGAHHVAYFYGLDMAATGAVMRIAQLADLALVVLSLTVLERMLRKKASK
jgi:uncharacterized membrane protein